jgi:hypothetical protein
MISIYVNCIRCSFNFRVKVGVNYSSFCFIQIEPQITEIWLAAFFRTHRVYDINVTFIFTPFFIIPVCRK